MKPSPDAPPLSLAPKRTSVGANGPTADGLAPAKSLDVAIKASPRPERAPEGFNSRPTADLRNRPDSGKGDVAVRVSVIDGNDRMVYSDVRDRRGWAQPLAVNEALREAGRRQGGTDFPANSPPRVILELEQRAPGVRSETRPLPGAASPYRIGKANIQSRSPPVPSQSVAAVAKDLSSTRTLAGPTRTR